MTSTKNAWKDIVPVEIGTRTETGEAMTLDLARVGSVLIGGESGTGKTQLIHAILTTLAREHTPEEVRFVIADSKIVIYGEFKKLPHLLRFEWSWAEAFEGLPDECERRAALLKKYACGDIRSFNEGVCAGTIREEKLPYIIFVVDDFADYMIADAQNFECGLTRLAVEGRALGIRPILATFRGHPDTVPCSLREKFDARIAFRTKSAKSSEVFLKRSGAETLREREFLFSADAEGGGKLSVVRVRAPEFSESDVESRIAEILKNPPTDSVPATDSPQKGAPEK